MAFFIVDPSLDAGLVKQFNTVILVGATETADSLPLAAFHGAMWLVTAVDVSGRTAFKEVIGLASAGSPSHIIPAKMGKDVSFAIDVNIAASAIRLRVTNTHTESLTAKVIRIETRI